MSLMYAQMGMSVVSAFGAHSSAQHATAMDRINRNYRETMTSISTAMQLNTMTNNEIEARDASVRASASLQQQALVDKANAQVSAAAAGVRGGSVANTLRSLDRSQLMAKKTLRDKQAAQARSATNNRRNLQLSRIMGQDISPIQGPSVASSMLGLGASIIDIYDSHQPEGSRIEDTIAGFWR